MELEQQILKLQQVYKINGFPEHTFVYPKEYNQLFVALDTPGRNIIIEGPSGIGKTSSIKKALQEANFAETPEILSARKSGDAERINEVSEGKFTLTIIDDFHRLSTEIKEKLANLLKTMADDETEEKKLILIGINDAGRYLVDIADDLVNRIEILTFESNSDEKILELINLGELALNIEINTKDEIVNSANGSFYLAQLLCYHSCLEAEVLKAELTPKPKHIEISFESVKSKVFNQLSKKFSERTVAFCQGSKLRPEGRAPYLNILYHLSKVPEWTLDLKQLARQDSELKGSISQVVTKNFLLDLYNKTPGIQEVVYFDQDAQKLTIQDPQFIYYLKNIKWHTFAREVGYSGLEFPKKYDFALSFAGEDRVLAENLFNELTERHVSVFYDKNEQHRMLASDVEDYLGPIYNSESEFIIVFLSESYPNKIWTKIESEAYEARLGQSIIPIIINSFPQNFTDPMKKVGHLSINTTKEIPPQVNYITEQLCAKLLESR